MAKLLAQLQIDSCPYCGRANPTLQATIEKPFTTCDVLGSNVRWWSAYSCRSCGGLIVASAPYANTNPLTRPVNFVAPRIPEINEAIPESPREYLRQAQNSFHAPAGSIMLSASAIDAMLKVKGLTTGSLYTRIDKAAEDHLITREMSEWAHKVRLDANEQRHADHGASLPTTEDAKETYELAKAFAEYLFVLPAKVARGIQEAEKGE